jgi:hypothetical protein
MTKLLKKYVVELEKRAILGDLEAARALAALVLMREHVKE